MEPREEEQKKLAKIVDEEVSSLLSKDFLVENSGTIAKMEFDMCACVHMGDVVRPLIR